MLSCHVCIENCKAALQGVLGGMIGFNYKMAFRAFKILWELIPRELLRHDSRTKKEGIRGGCLVQVAF